MGALPAANYIPRVSEEGSGRPGEIRVPRGIRVASGSRVQICVWFVGQRNNPNHHHY